LTIGGALFTGAFAPGGFRENLFAVSAFMRAH
jgi:hypothetical protein